MEFWDYPFKIGEVAVSPKSLTIGLLLFAVLAFIVSRLKRILKTRILPRAGLTTGVSIAIATLISYAFFLLGALMILPIMIPGFNIATLTVVLGALSFGIGFGLRNIADNFISGIILLVERPIKVGDRIHVGEVMGTVTGIRIRSTTVQTNDNIDIIVPNSEFISGTVTNLSYSDQRVRFKVPVGVHYKSDVRVVEKALLEAAAECPDVLKAPPSVVRFIQFGDSSLDFELVVWTETLFDKPKLLISSVNFLIWEKFKKYGIEIPYPQRDIYIKEMPGTDAEPQSKQSVAPSNP
ncbi:MAG: mechanosensitive ion channel [Verrucomicrobia bacterium]|nr:mechanosensitive ion channel [Verrucomicrobiota bacterium]